MTVTEVSILRDFLSSHFKWFVLWQGISTSLPVRPFSEKFHPTSLLDWWKWLLNNPHGCSGSGSTHYIESWLGNQITFQIPRKMLLGRHRRRWNRTNCAAAVLLRTWNWELLRSKWTSDRIDGSKTRYEVKSVPTFLVVSKHQLWWGHMGFFMDFLNPPPFTTWDSCCRFHIRPSSSTKTHLKMQTKDRQVFV